MKKVNELKSRLRLLRTVVKPPVVFTVTGDELPDLERRIANLELAVFGQRDPPRTVRRRRRCHFCRRWVVYRYVLKTDIRSSTPPGFLPHVCRSCRDEWNAEVGDTRDDWELWDSGEVLGSRDLSC